MLLKGENWSAWVRESASVIRRTTNGPVYLAGLVPMHSVTRLKERRRVTNRNHETIQRERKLARRIFGGV